MALGSSGVWGCLLCPLLGQVPLFWEEVFPESASSSWERQIPKRAVLSLPAVPTPFQIIPVVSLLVNIYLCTFAISRNLGGGEVAWASPRVPFHLPLTSLGPGTCLPDTGKPAFTSPLCHQAAIVRTGLPPVALPTPAPPPLAVPKPNWSPKHCL